MSEDNARIAYAVWDARMMTGDIRTRRLSTNRRSALNRARSDLNGPIDWESIVVMVVYTDCIMDHFSRKTLCILHHENNFD
jgi:hypothetical protein